MGRLYVMIYALPLHMIVILAAEFLALWGLVSRWYAGAEGRARRRWKLLCGGLFLVWLAVILHMTVLSRTGGELVVQREFFHQLKMYFAGGDKECLRVLWMNLFLFIPGGLLLETVWPERVPRLLCAVLTLALLTALSVGIEAVQFRYALGHVEADDVLCNALGALCGLAVQELCLHRAQRAQTD